MRVYSTLTLALAAIARLAHVCRSSCGVSPSTPMAVAAGSNTRLPLISDVGNLRLLEGSPDLEVHTSAAAETALLLGLVTINAAPFSVIHGAVQFLVHGQARSGGSAHATENPARWTLGSS